LAALKKDQDNRFDLVFIDWKMPGMDGLETSRRIKAMDGIAVKPEIIMITAYDLSELPSEASEASQIGINKHLTKPVTESQLFDVVMDVFGAGGDKSFAFSHDGHKGLISDRSADIKGAKILLVEDNEINQQVAQEILQQMGIEVDIAGDGLQAVKILKKIKYDAVLMDVQMPVMDGYEATRQIRNNLGLVNLPIIAMTANAIIGDRKKSIDAGMFDYVTKPINPVEVLEVLVKWIKPKSRSTSGTDKFNREGFNSDKLPWPDIPRISLTDGMTRLGGNRKLYRKLLSQFCDINIIVRPLLINLAQMLESGSIKCVKQLRVLDSHLSNTKLEKQFQQLRKDVDMFDMDSALGRLKAIASALEISL